MFRKILKLAGWVLFMAFVVFTLAFTTREVSNVKCSRIEVLYDGHQAISLGDDEIVNMVKSADSKILGKDIRRKNRNGS